MTNCSALLSDQNKDRIKSFEEMRSQDLSKDEIDELVTIVKKEISGRSAQEHA